MTFTKIFAAGVKRKFEEDNISLPNLSKLTGVPRSSLRRLMQGKGGITLETAFKIAEAMGATIDAVALAGLQGDEDGNEQRSKQQEPKES